MRPIVPDLGMTTTELNRLMFALDNARSLVKGKEVDKEQHKLIMDSIKLIEKEVHHAVS